MTQDLRRRQWEISRMEDRLETLRRRKTLTLFALFICAVLVAYSFSAYQAPSTAIETQRGLWGACNQHAIDEMRRENP